MKPTYVLYVNVGSKSPTKAKEYMENMKSSIKEQLSEEVVLIALPIRNGETRIELLSGASVLDESFNAIHTEVEKGFLAAQKMFERVTDRLEKFYSDLKK